MIIGFTQRSQTISEYLEYGYIHQLTIVIASEKISERTYSIALHIQDSKSQATIGTLNQTDMLFDAYFGERLNSNSFLQYTVQLLPGEDLILVAVPILNDYDYESQECFTIDISPFDTDVDFTCNDGEDAMDYFCNRTVCIDDDDGKLKLQSYNVKFGTHNYYSMCTSFCKKIVYLLCTISNNEIFCMFLIL